MVMIRESQKMHGVVIKDLTVYTDDRGWLAELYRNDELPETLIPAMSYISMTLPGIARGPHEHIDQTDYFCFVGPSTFKVYLWDNRVGSRTIGEKMTITAGQGEPKLVIVPPGIVHAYKNIGGVPGMVFNAPNRLYMGKGKKEVADEKRHEDDEYSPYKLD